MEQGKGFTDQWAQAGWSHLEELSGNSFYCTCSSCKDPAAASEESFLLQAFCGCSCLKFDAVQIMLPHPACQYQHQFFLFYFHDSQISLGTEAPSMAFPAEINSPIVFARLACLWVSEDSWMREEVDHRPSGACDPPLLGIISAKRVSLEQAPPLISALAAASHQQSCMIDQTSEWRSCVINLRTQHALMPFSVIFHKKVRNLHE